MSKKVKMVLYGEPGVGKSTFASKCPNPLFLTTDGNFEWLGLPDKNHIRLSSWDQAKKVINDLVNGKYSEYQTIVVDLIEGLYVWAEKEFCDSKKIEHIGDYKSMGAGYSVVRKEFFAEISKLISVDKHVIFLSHSVTIMEKNRVGAETYKYYPSNKISIDKQWDDIEGQVRYFLRAYFKPEEVNGKIVKKRYLSIVPKENEYGIARGLDESNTPEDIALDWNTFAQVIGLNDELTTPVVHRVINEPKLEPKVEPEVEPLINKKEEVVIKTTVTTPIVEKTEPVQEVTNKVVPEVIKEKEEVISAPKQATIQNDGQLSQADKIAAIKAKLAAMKK